MDNGTEFSAQIEMLGNVMKQKKSVYFCAQLGWGKTAFIRKYFSCTGQKYHYISCFGSCFTGIAESVNSTAAKHIVIDDAQALNKDDINELSHLLANDNRKYYILSRCVLPEALTPFYITGQLKTFNNDFFSLSTEEIGAMFKSEGKIITKTRLNEILTLTNGWYLGVAALLRQYNEKHSFGEIVERAKIDMYIYFDLRLFEELPEKLRHFLMYVGHLKSFTEQAAQLLLAKESVKPEIDCALGIGSFLEYTPPDKYSFVWIFSDYLIWKQKKECSPEFLRRLYENTGLYYVLNHDILNALKYYNMSGNTQRVSELLLSNAENHPGNGYFYQMREYYFSLPDEIVNKSPEFLSTLSMIYSVLCNPEKSEEYYHKLKKLSETAPQDVSHRAKMKLIYLDIGLPHRGSKNIIELLTECAKATIYKPEELQFLSITGNMPSLLNGGKDFSQWTKRDKFLYNTLKAPASKALGSRYKGFAEVAIGESLFEKNADGNFTHELTYLNMGYFDIQSCGNEQLEFAVLAVMARIFVCQGKLEAAIDSIIKLQNRTQSDSELAQNIDAFLTGLYILDGNTQRINDWYNPKSPDENDGFCTLERYRYITKIKVYIIKNEYERALSLLTQADVYFKNYDRTYFHIEALILRSIILYRRGDTEWRESLSEALNICNEFKYIRVMAKHGAAVLEPLRKIAADNEFHRTILKNTEKQASFYPNYLSSENNVRYTLTEAEERVLSLICKGLSNDEIAELLNVSIHAVKFHITKIYSKLKVKNRTEAIRLCSERFII